MPWWFIAVKLKGPFFIHLLIDLSETSFEVHSKFRYNPAGTTGTTILVESQAIQLTQAGEQSLKFLWKLALPWEPSTWEYSFILCPTSSIHCNLSKLIIFNKIHLCFDLRSGRSAEGLNKNGFEYLLCQQRAPTDQLYSWQITKVCLKTIKNSKLPPKGMIE